MKKDQIAPLQAKNWIENLESEETFNLLMPELILQKSTYKLLSDRNLFRIRVKPGLELIDGQYQICAFAVSSVSDGVCSGNYLDNPTPVYKLTPVNEDYSDNLEEVEAAVDLWKSWRLGEIGDGLDAPARQYIYPISWLLTKSELYEIFVNEAMDFSQIGFGITKAFTPMIYSEAIPEDGIGDTTEVFDFTDPCPPDC